MGLVSSERRQLPRTKLWAWFNESLVSGNLLGVGFDECDKLVILLLESFGSLLLSLGSRSLGEFGGSIGSLGSSHGVVTGGLCFLGCGHGIVSRFLSGLTLLLVLCNLGVKCLCLLGQLIDKLTFLSHLLIEDVGAVFPAVVVARGEHCGGTASEHRQKGNFYKFFLHKFN